MNIDKMKKEMENETENVNIEISDDELEQAAGGEFAPLQFCCTCPKCCSWGKEYRKEQDRTIYRCVKCGYVWWE